MIKEKKSHFLMEDFMLMVDLVAFCGDKFAILRRSSNFRKIKDGSNWMQRLTEFSDTDNIFLKFRVC